jgi:hypothetical protein
MTSYILNTHIHKIRFRIDKDASKDYMDKWEQLKYRCENGDNKYIIDKMKTYCKLEQNKIIPYLQRCEGGMGGDCNIENKQIRFRMVMEDWKKYLPDYMDNDIILHEIINGKNEKWSYEELDDFIYALTKTFNYYLGTNCVNGVIELYNKDCLGDDYLDSDDDLE